MAEANLSPRQKMIGMMYLVLMAMLALNVQREILNAFAVLNDGNEASTESAEKRNESLYSEFKFAFNLDKEKVEPYWNTAQQIQREADELVNYIDSIRIQVISNTEGLEIHEADTISLDLIEGLDRYDEATRILIGIKEDGSTGEARNLHNAMLDIESRITSHFDGLGLPAPKLAVDFSDRFSEDNGRMNWEMYTFYESPLAAVVAILSKLKNDVRAYEYNAVGTLFGQIDVDDIPVDTVLARVIPKSNFVILGETYESEVFLGAYSTTTAPEMVIGEIDESTGEVVGTANSLDVTDGVGNYSITPKREGLHTYSGTVKVTDKKGTSRYFPFESEFMVAKPMAVISPTKMNVLYIGPDNPISVSVPGVPDDQLKVSITGNNTLKRVGPGQYEAKLRPGGPKEVDVVVSAELDGKLREMGRLKFRAKPLPEPKFKFGKAIKNSSMTKNEAKVSGVRGLYGGDFLFDLPLTVTGFTLSAVKNGLVVDYDVVGNKLDRDAESFINSLKAGTDMYVENVKIKDVNGKIWEPNGIKIKLKRN